MRPIDADAVLKKVLSIPPYCGHCDGYGFVELDMVEDAIKDAPTIEAEIVKHGRWNLRNSCQRFGYYCSNCNIEAIYTGTKLNYCPACGAKMDLEET